MSLTFIVGSAGSGKSHLLYERLTNNASKYENRNEDYIALVPEQYSMEAQREILLASDRHGSFNTEVVSFQRLAVGIFEELGMTDIKVMDDLGKTLVVRKVLEICKKDLKYYHNKANMPGFVDRAKTLITELKQYNYRTQDLEKMIDDAAKEGYSLIICSSYRDYERQNELQKESISQYMDKGLSYHDAFFRVKRTLALTGTSEHHTGLSVDIVGEDYQCLDEEQATRPTAIWLAEYCAEYGFVVRYDRGKEDITGMDYESWHFRYVGKEAAAFMEEYDLCLEEFSDMVEFFHRPDEGE